MQGAKYLTKLYSEALKLEVLIAKVFKLFLRLKGQK